MSTVQTISPQSKNKTEESETGFFKQHRNDQGSMSLPAFSHGNILQASCDCPGECHHKVAERTNVVDEGNQTTINLKPAVGSHASMSGHQAEKEEEEESFKPESTEKLKFSGHPDGSSMNSSMIIPAVQMTGNSTADAAPEGFENELNQTKGEGNTLPAKVSDEMKRKIGADFSDVKIHQGDRANELSDQIGAKAFAHGNDVFFSSGAYNPNSKEGKHLLAHELTHTVQQQSESIQTVRKFEGEEEEESQLPTMQRPVPPPRRQETDQADSQDTISAAPLESFTDCVVDFPTQQLMDQQHFEREWSIVERDFDFLSIPTEAGILLEVGGHMNNTVSFSADFGEMGIRNLRLGLNGAMCQAFQLAQVFVGNEGLPALARQFPGAMSDFTAEGEIYIPAQATLAVDLDVGFDVAASAAGIFDLASIGGGINASASASARAELTMQGQFIYQNGALQVNGFFPLTDLEFALAYNISPYVEASFLGWDTRYEYDLASGRYAFGWHPDENLRILTQPDGERMARFNIEDDLFPVVHMVQDIFNEDNAERRTTNRENANHDIGLSIPTDIRAMQDFTNYDNELVQRMTRKRRQVNSRKLARRRRRPELSDHPYYLFLGSNIAAVRYRIMNDQGETVGRERNYLERSNSGRGGNHSEVNILGLLESVRSRHPGMWVVVEELISERSPCHNCRYELGRRHARTGVPTVHTREANKFFLVPYTGSAFNRNAALMERYGLPRPTREEINE